CSTWDSSLSTRLF
nr:immunoglobulin light chain junction region [Macaca mulatta]MPO03331.1 immunoglobulin light chain junction region [Macaca mulatta]MPO03542.1 immunoglobulin light chain junction region [Macaca mulatta]MPO03637.1 immunoglobulin light chain junction region [Macaca mulatta]MPO03834.1 immunoglobulin light chain junction region [Macaca mulatta]